MKYSFLVAIALACAVVLVQAAQQSEGGVEYLKQVPREEAKQALTALYKNIAFALQPNFKPVCGKQRGGKIAYRAEKVNHVPFAQGKLQRGADASKRIERQIAAQIAAFPREANHQTQYEAWKEFQERCQVFEEIQRELEEVVQGRQRIVNWLDRPLKDSKYRLGALKKRIAQITSEAALSGMAPSSELVERISAAQRAYEVAFVYLTDRKKGVKESLKEAQGELDRASKAIISAKQRVTEPVSSWGESLNGWWSSTTP